MTNEKPPVSSQPEAKVPRRTDYEQSVQRLFGILEYAPNDDTAGVYFYPSWNPTRPRQLSDISVIQATPTGALKQERAGHFLSAQFRVTELSEVTSDVQQSFQWHYTGFQYPGRPLLPDSDYLRARTGYQVLEPLTIMNELAAHASSLRDYDALLEAMQKYSLDPTTGIADDLDRMVYNLVSKDSDQQVELLGSTTNRQAMVRHIRHLKELNPSLAKSIEGRLVSRLMRTIGWGWTTIIGTKKEHDVQDAAATALEQAFEEGILPEESRIVRRVLASRAVFRYPFATSLLHREVTEIGYQGTPQKLFGLDRAGYIRDYMLMVLDGKGRRGGMENPAVQRLVQKYLTQAQSFEYVSSNHSRDTIFALADEIVDLQNPGAANSDDMQSDETEVAGYSNQDFSDAFGLILSATKLKDPEAEEERAAFDSMSIEAVNIMLRGPLHKAIGKPVVEQSVETL